MLSLFPEIVTQPPGFRYVPDFISATDELQLLGFIRQLTLHPFQFQGYEAKRKVLSFGLDYDFKSRMLHTGSPMPATLLPIIERVAKELHCSPTEIAEVLITEYPVGSVINWHRDAPPFKSIAGVSLAASCIFKFRPHDEARRSKRSIINISVAPRSLYVIEGAARSDWQHSTGPVKEIRYSITFRTLNK